jgi:hypothetical protein
MLTSLAISPLLYLLLATRADMLGVTSVIVLALRPVRVSRKFHLH